MKNKAIGFDIFSFSFKVLGWTAHANSWKTIHSRWTQPGRRLSQSLESQNSFKYDLIMFHCAHVGHAARSQMWCACMATLVDSLIHHLRIWGNRERQLSLNGSHDRFPSPALTVQLRRENEVTAYCWGLSSFINPLCCFGKFCFFPSKILGFQMHELRSELPCQSPEVVW